MSNRDRILFELNNSPHTSYIIEKLTVAGKTIFLRHDRQGISIVPNKNILFPEHEPDGTYFSILSIKKLP